MLELMKERDKRATEYAIVQGIALIDRLGHGWDGSVFSTSRFSAIKAFEFQMLYGNELAVYQRLRDRGIVAIDGFNVPQLLRFDHELWVLELTIVRPPFVLDFAGARLDKRPEYPDDVYEDWLLAKEEQFGDRWPTVLSVMSRFAYMGIYLTDVKPGNIEFAEPIGDDHG
jgi:hypothetical protein